MAFSINRIPEDIVLTVLHSTNDGQKDSGIVYGTIRYCIDGTPNPIESIFRFFDKHIDSVIIDTKTTTLIYDNVAWEYSFVLKSVIPADMPTVLAEFIEHLRVNVAWQDIEKLTVLLRSFGVDKTHILLLKEKGRFFRENFPPELAPEDEALLESKETFWVPVGGLNVWS